MNRPNCQTTNPDEARLCSNCGNNLTQVCPNCSTENSIHSNFCGHCDKPLQGAAQPADASQDKLLQYIPKELLDKLESARAGQAMAGERRVVTILFCDVKGSTAAAEKIDSEDWAEIMNGAFDLEGGYWAESRGISFETNRPYGQDQQQLRLLWGIGELGEVPLARLGSLPRLEF